MPLVFVHGVATRKDSDYVEQVNIRDGYFRSFALADVVDAPATAKVENPYWGDFAAKMAWNNASLPDGDYESFGSADGIPEEILDDIVPGLRADPDKIALTVARSYSLRQAVDLLWAAAAFLAEADGADELVDTAPRVAGYADDADGRGDLAWLDSLTNDEQFVTELLDRAEKWTPSTNTREPQTVKIESFGGSKLFGRITEALQNLGQKAGGVISGAAGAIAGAASSGTQFIVGAASGAAVSAVRPWAHNRASTFLGDIFVYLDERGTPEAPGQIVTEVKRALADAARIRKDTGEKLVVVAHSMGGNITYDILTSYADDLPDLHVDVFATVGSQVGLFEELKLFKASDSTLPSATTKKIPVPSRIGRWINVFDRADALGYAVSRIWDGAEDYKFVTGTSPLGAHSMYFYRPLFHQRLRSRILNLS